MKATKLVLLTIAVALFATVAWAESFTPPELSGTVFAYYRYDLSSKDESYREGANEFAIDRVYVNFIGAVTEKLHYRVTADVGRETDTYYTYELERDPETGEVTGLKATPHTKRGRYDFFAKFAYLDVRDVIPYHSIYGGMEKTPWVCYEQSEYWGWRVLRKAAICDRGWEPPSDLGFGIGGEFGNGLIQHHLTYTNGAGFNNPEGGLSGKAVAYRFSLFPLVATEALPGLSVNGFVKMDNLGEKVADDAAKDPVQVFGGLLGLKHEYVSFGGGYFMRSEGEDDEAAGVTKKDGNIMTAYATGHFRVSEGMTLHPLVRYDTYEPDKNADDDERTLIIGGVGLKFFDDKLALIPNYQTESYKVTVEEPGQEPVTEDKSNDYVYLHCQWDWL
jgi:hypothetical protein